MASGDTLTVALLTMPDWTGPSYNIVVKATGSNGQRGFSATASLASVVAATSSLAVSWLSNTPDTGIWAAGLNWITDSVPLYLIKNSYNIWTLKVTPQAGSTNVRRVDLTFPSFPFLDANCKVTGLLPNNTAFPLPI